MGCNQAIPNTEHEASVHAPEACLFFARAPQDVTEEELTALFSEHGAVEEVSIYRSWPSAKTSKGCGTVQFRDKAAASAALQALNGSSNLPRLEGPLVVERMDPRKQKATPPAAGTKKSSRRRLGARDTQPATDQAPTGTQDPRSTFAAAAAAGMPAAYMLAGNSGAWGSHAEMISPAASDDAAMMAMMSMEMQAMGLMSRADAAASRSASFSSSTDSIIQRSISAGNATLTHHMRHTWGGTADPAAARMFSTADASAGWAPGPPMHAAWQQQQQQQWGPRAARQAGACPRNRRSSAPSCAAGTGGSFSAWLGDGPAAGTAQAWSMDAAAAAAAAAAGGAARQLRRPASMQGCSSFSSWGGFASPLLLQHQGLQTQRFGTPPAAAAASAQAVYRSLDARLTQHSAGSVVGYGSSSSSSSVGGTSPPNAPLLAASQHDMALLGNAMMSQPMLMSPGPFDVMAAAPAAFPFASAGSNAFSVSSDMQVAGLDMTGQLYSDGVCIGSTLQATNGGHQALGYLDQGDPSDVSLMDWLALQQQLQQQEAAGMAAAAAAAAGSPPDQSWMAGVGIAAAPSSAGGSAEQLPALLLGGNAPSPGVGSPVLGLAAAAAAAVPVALPPPAPPPVAVRAAAVAAAAVRPDPVMLGMQQHLPLPPTQQQQQSMRVELEPQAWESIAQKGGWQDVVRLSGAQIEVQVQESSRLLALQVSGTAAQVDMVGKLMCLLLQQPAMAARAAGVRA
uniref:RRM domain-containing protein n=1 Tax=Tetradesmus obliquus TaxID=3088 RepID=A0A383W1T6_TETOB|eukprot:jgi/Sobl393_1/11836/SZX70626.1